MNGRQSKRADEPTPRDHGHDGQPELADISTETVCDLLGDRYARRLLTLLVERPRTGRELIEETDMSRPTVYRRLGRLRTSGLVRTETELDTDGHHRNRFYATVNGCDFAVGDTGIETRVRPSDDDRSGRGGSITSGHDE
ncbi:transcriptional regulator, ArsR family protein [Halovivax asiaticus JCM 14624]|uniref:Transcriptional regulator, ArsR family protein n=1 Tax=Halovivax asiaticus JCM 14624 TaxID=1227490 RepID=M0BSF1_9EURY|nr:winged helix-turn-helix domain-containing protein [Halovivax asiaticus]ELZ13875.1 transcriptional regulator, ArsR family protein [Halovivax asiaticus JCM 14624]